MQGLNFGSEVVRIWEFREDENKMDAVVILLRHNPVTKFVQLSVNGSDLAPDVLQFKVGNNVSGRVELQAPNSSFFSRFSNYKYKCYVVSKGLGEVVLKESNEKLKDLDDGVGEVAVKIPEVIVDGRNIAWYKLEVMIERLYRGQKRNMYFAVHRRFRDFRFVYSQICNSYRGTHLLGSVPKPPPRHPKFLEDHFDVEFLEKRRVELESWLRRTLLVPRTALNPDVNAFLGMGDPSMREVSIAIDSGSLGLRLKKNSPPESSSQRDIFPQASVASFMKGDDGKPGVAELSGLISVGDVISKISGESVVNLCYEAIVPMLKNSPKPMIIHFLGSTLASRGASSRNLSVENEGDYDNFVGNTPKHEENLTTRFEDDDVEEDTFLGSSEPDEKQSQPKSTPVPAKNSPRTEVQVPEPDLFPGSDTEQDDDQMSKDLADLPKVAKESNLPLPSSTKPVNSSVPKKTQPSLFDDDDERDPFGSASHTATTISPAEALAKLSSSKTVEENLVAPTTDVAKENDSTTTAAIEEYSVAPSIDTTEESSVATLNTAMEEISVKPSADASEPKSDGSEGKAVEEISFADVPVVTPPPRTILAPESAAAGGEVDETNVDKPAESRPPPVPPRLSVDDSTSTSLLNNINISDKVADVEHENNSSEAYNDDDLMEDINF